MLWIFSYIYGWYTADLHGWYTHFTSRQCPIKRIPIMNYSELNVIVGASKSTKRNLKRSSNYYTSVVFSINAFICIYCNWSWHQFWSVVKGFLYLIDSICPMFSVRRESSRHTGENICKIAFFHYNQPLFLSAQQVGRLFLAVPQRALSFYDV